MTGTESDPSPSEICDPGRHGSKGAVNNNYNVFIFRGWHIKYKYELM